MKGNPSLCCSLMGRHGIGVCREWLNFARRPGTIRSRLPLCNRPFPSRIATSGKTYRRRGEAWKSQCLVLERSFFSPWKTQDFIKEKLGYHMYCIKSSRLTFVPTHQTQTCWNRRFSVFVNEPFYTGATRHLIFPHRWWHMDPIQSLLYHFMYMIVSCLLSPWALSSCLANFYNVKIKTWLKALKITTLSKLFFFFNTVWDVLPHRAPISQWSNRDYLSR